MVAKQPEDLLLGSARLRYRDDSNTFERELGEFCGLGQSVFAPRDTMSRRRCRVPDARNCGI